MAIRSSRETWRDMIENLEKQSAAEIGRLIAKGGLDPVEVAEFFLDRIERDRDNPSFIVVTRERALEEAAASRKRHREGRAAGPLDGVPIAWKDLVDMAGERTTAGSALYARSPPKTEGRADRRKPRRGRPRGAGQDQSLGIRLLGAWAQSAFRNAAKPARSRNATHRGRILVRRGGRGRRRPCALRDRQRHRRLDPRAGELLRHRRVQDERGADRQAGRLSALAHARHDRPAGAYGRGLRADRRGACAASRLLPCAPSISAASNSSCRTRSGIDDAEPAVAANLESAMKRLAAAGAKVTSRPVHAIGAMRALVAQYGSLVAIEAYAEHRAML